MSADGKHVIFLGAGASKSSGYPLARELTRLMADRLHFLSHVRKLHDRQEPTQEQRKSLHETIVPLFEAFEPASKLLKEGSFATMDELSNLAFGGRRSGDILQLKKLVRLIFALDNPYQWHYGSSDYPDFVNALFRGREVVRDDVCVLSLNYDPYLEYLLFLGLSTRHEVRDVADKTRQYAQQAATSGFLNPTSLDWLEQDGFSHLKLHGTAVLPTNNQRVANREFHWQHLYGLDMHRRCVDAKEAGNQDPPVLLPWEIIHPSECRLLNEDEFRKSVGSAWQHSNLHSLFSGIWKRARNEIQNARKVSFVGMSMAALYEPALEYLLSGRRLDKPLQLLSVSPSNKETRKGGTGAPLDRVTPAGKLYHFLSQVLRRNPFAPEQIGTIEGFERTVGMDWTYEFSQFIALHMD